MAGDDCAAAVGEERHPFAFACQEFIQVALTGGHERTRAEYRQLVEATGFIWQRVISLQVHDDFSPMLICLLEAAPRAFREAR
jgi:hypothetical protein